ncbi:hypothetical protein CH298_27675 [Rhodococcoides fascians]|uniref:hypothetical protein n=1 Tax=Rhodococcoides fascians TaxID=1828 RepID=UPI000B9AC40D|nr:MULTISPECIES: hypothetical protein [Rhodococcus]MBJ7324317.1 hypothetical protein [Rhodococcus sp. (in: high G+C Gram-positive bacteria)]MDJ0471683.1 hypothetical protein [Rhodococcus fascians]OZE81666.1 hypothetical protein CH303_26940 [Rhodococcus fascians]OZF08919.1 hypothetical protein CH298_27675 [Rhodococcus fascians]OZF12360.1 hypothetical protein CH297_27490 [Rhodococcus fascians]
MATVDAIPDLTGLDKATQLDVLRRRMATVPGGRRDHAPAELPTITAPEPAAPIAGGTDLTGKTDDPEPLSAAVRGKTLRTMPVPPPLAELLPRRALTRGTAVTVAGAGSMLIALIAEASAAGHHVALIGQPRLSLLAVHEHGGDLAKVHLVDPGAGDPLDAASICLDGLDLVVTTVHGRDVPPTRARALLARNRRHASVLLLTDGHMPGIDLTIASTVAGYGGIEQGRGRIKSITLETTVHGRGTPHRTGRYTLTAPTFGETGLRWTPTPADELAGHRPVAVAQ